MAVIKANTSSAQPTAFSMADIEKAAEQMVLRARQQAQQILSEARAEADRLKLNAHAQGLAQGKVDGMAQGRAEGAAAGRQAGVNEYKGQLAQLVSALTQALAEIDQSRQLLLTHGLDSVTQLALAVTQRITHTLGGIDPAVLSRNLELALKLTVDKTAVRIVIHPSQRKLLGDVLPALQLQWPTLAHATLVEDASIAPGGCRLIAGNGQIDATLRAQLDRITAELFPDTADIAEATAPLGPAPTADGEAA